MMVKNFLPKNSVKNMQHEGVVVRTADYDKDNGIGVSFKVKNIGYQERGLGKIHQDCVGYKNNHGVNYDRQRVCRKI